LIVFVIGAAIIWIREVDGAGVTQNYELRLLVILVLLIAFIFPVIIQVAWLVVNLRMGSNK
jgi:hypothetical protein